MDCIVTLDAGTGSGRCVAFDAAGQPLASAQEPFQYQRFTNPDVPFVRGFDLDARAFWSALARCARATLAALPADARIRGVIATSQREGCVFLDAADDILYAGPNLDARAFAEGMELEQQIGAERLHRITGHAPPYIFPAARYAWYRKHHDGARVARLFMLNDWITYRLSGVAVAEPSNAGESMLYDVSRREWSAEILETLDIPPAILPEVRPAGTCVGGVTARAAAETGIPAGTPVFVGGADTESALLGSGVYEPGMTGAVLGTTTPVQTVVDHPLIDSRGNLWTSCHVVPDRWVLESNAGDTGDSYRWLLELMYGAADASTYAMAEDAIRSRDSAPSQVYCHFGPVIFNLRELNPLKPAGMLFRFPLLHVDRPLRGEILHAFFENVAFAIRGNCEQIAAVSGASIPVLTVSGGMTQSAPLAGLIATVLGVPLAVATVVETASLGCAMLVAVGAGLHAGVGDAVAAMSRRRVVEPVAGEMSEYDDRYQRWREVYGKLAAWVL